jgi:hypothetical protein
MSAACHGRGPSRLTQNHLGGPPCDGTRVCRSSRRTRSWWAVAHITRTAASRSLGSRSKSDSRGRRL